MTTEKLDMQEVKRCLKRAAETADGNEAPSTSICIRGGEHLQFIALSIHLPVLPFHQNNFHTFPHSVC